MKKYLFLFVAAATLFGCSTELEVNAPYKDITVVYGLLNQEDSVHFIKINKAFLGEGDAFVYAQVQDSNEFHDEAITHKMIHRLNANGQRVESFELFDTLITDREPGVFYAPEQVVYKFDHHLNQLAEYELDLIVKGEQISARTDVVNDFSISSVNVAPQVPVSFHNGQGYVPYILRWSSGRNGKRYEVSWRFRYTELRNGVETEKMVEQRMGTRVANHTATGGESMEISYPGEQFFSVLGGKIPADAEVEQRIFRGLDFVIAVANDEFHTVLTLSEPISGIIEERPAYSNVENGYGIFASRYSKGVFGKRFSTPHTTNELINGPHTGHLNFCYDHDGIMVCD